MTKTSFPKSILLFGCGNMSGAILTGLIKAGAAPEHFHIVDPFAKNLPNNVKYYTDAADVSEKFDVILLGIKPQMLAQLAPDIRPLLNPGAKLISILAGTPTRILENIFPDCRSIRLMPNLAVSIGKSPMGLFSNSLDDDAMADVTRWFTPLGHIIWINDEVQMDAVTALAGSGPAFVYRFIDALAKAGAELGMDARQSAQMAISMVEGAAILAASAEETPEQLATRVTSPGGTTAAGLAMMDDDDAIQKLMLKTLRAARDRGVELAKEAE